MANEYQSGGQSAIVGIKAATYGSVIAFLYFIAIIAMMFVVPATSRADFTIYDKSVASKDDGRNSTVSLNFFDLMHSMINTHPLILSSKQNVADAIFINVQGICGAFPDISFTRSRSVSMDYSPYTLNDSQDLNISVSTLGLTAYPAIAKLSSSIKNARIQEGISVRDQLLIDFYEAYLGLYGSKKSLEVAEEYLLLSQMNYEAKRKGVELDRSQAHELIAAEAGLLDAEAKVVDVQGSISRYVADIEDLTGISLSEDDIERITREGMSNFQIPTGDVNRMCEQVGLYDAIKTRNPRIRAMTFYSNSKWAESAIEASKTFLPRLNLSFDSSLGWKTTGAGSIVSVTDPGGAQASNQLSAQLVIPILPNGGTGIVNAARYRIKGKREKYDRNSALLEILSKARKTCDGAKNQLLALDSKRRIVDSLDLVLQESMESNRDGKKSDIDVVSARAAFLKSRADYFEADSALKISTARIMSIRGEGHLLMKPKSRQTTSSVGYSNDFYRNN